MFMKAGLVKKQNSPSPEPSSWFPRRENWSESPDGKLPIHFPWLGRSPDACAKLALVCLLKGKRHSVAVGKVTLLLFLASGSSMMHQEIHKANYESGGIGTENPEHRKRFGQGPRSPPFLGMFQPRDLDMARQTMPRAFPLQDFVVLGGATHKTKKTQPLSPTPRAKAGSDFLGCAPPLPWHR